MLALGACAALLHPAGADRDDETLVVLEEDEPQTPYPFQARYMSEQRLAELLFDRFFHYSASGYYESNVFGNAMANAPGLQLEVDPELMLANGTAATFSDAAYSMNSVYRSCRVAPDACGWFGLVFGEARQITDRIGEISFQVSMPEEEPEQYLTTTTLYSRRSLDPQGTGSADADVVGSLRDPVGTGPFWADRTIESFDDIRLRRNPHRPAREGVVGNLRLLYDQDAARQKELMLGHKADLWVAPPPSVIPEFSTQTDVFKVTGYELNQWWFVAIDTHDSELSDPKLRQALDHLVPRQQLMEKFGGTSATAISGPFMPGSAWCAPDTQPTGENADAAARLLQQAGYTRQGSMWMNGSEQLSLVLGVQSDIVDDYYDVVYGLADAWESAGIRIKVRAIRPSDWREVVESGRAPDQFDMVLGRWNVDREEGALHLFTPAEDGSRTVNIMAYDNADVTSTVQAFYDESSGPEREAVMRSLHSKLHDDRPYLFLWSLRINSVYRKDRLKGVRAARFYYYTTIDDWRWRETPSTP